MIMTTLTCPLGHRFRIPKVVYGDPTPEAMDAAGRGELTLGGCMPDLPVTRICPKCGLATQWPPVADTVAVKRAPDRAPNATASGDLNVD